MMFQWKKTLHLIRGLPGEGKSTLAYILVKDREKIVENDDFWFVPKSQVADDSFVQFLTGNYAQKISGPYNLSVNKYKYEYLSEMTHLAGNWCAAEAFRRLRIFDEIAVANTFIKREYIYGYIEQARKLEIKVLLHRPTTSWIGNEEECFKNNIHGVPIETLQKMKASWEEMTQEEVDILLNMPK